MTTTVPAPEHVVTVLRARHDRAVALITVLCALAEAVLDQGDAAAGRDLLARINAEAAMRDRIRATGIPLA